MRISEIVKETAGVGRIVKGVNTTKDVGTNEVATQAAKFGNKVSRGGRPPIASTSGKDAINEEVWDTPNPKKKQSRKLTPAQKSAAKARAKRASRPYPNLIDNMWASKR